MKNLLTTKIKALAQKLTPQLRDKYSTPTIFSADGSKSVTFYDNGYGIVAIANLVNADGGYGNDNYWFAIGTYKTLENAIRAAIRRLERHNVALVLDVDEVAA